jgi:hypothetical protein
MDRHGHPHTRVSTGELFEHEDVGQEVGARPAQLFGDADTHEPEEGELPEELARKAVFAVPFGRVRHDLGLRELPRERLDLMLLG